MFSRGYAVLPENRAFCCNTGMSCSVRPSPDNPLSVSVRCDGLPRCRTGDMLSSWGLAAVEVAGLGPNGWNVGIQTLLLLCPLVGRPNRFLFLPNAL